MANKEMNEINNKLIDFVKSWNLIQPDKITLDTLIEKDLGITGDDAIDFIEEFAKKFDVDIVSFDYSKYFGSEGIDIFDVFSRLFFQKRTTNHTDMSLRELGEAIRSGKLE